MPQAHRKNTRLSQAQPLKPCSMPYQGTKTSAASGVSVKTVVVSQLIGACSSGRAAESVLISGGYLCVPGRQMSAHSTGAGWARFTYRRLANGTYLPKRSAIL